MRHKRGFLAVIYDVPLDRAAALNQTHYDGLVADSRALAALLGATDSDLATNVGFVYFDVTGKLSRRSGFVPRRHEFAELVADAPSAFVGNWSFTRTLHW